MADVKISQLPAATTPLDGTELTPIVQSGTTKRVSVANLTVGRALTASSLTLSTPLSAANGGTGLTSLGTGIATFLGTPTSANLAAAVTDETGTGALVFGTTPTFTTSALFPAGTVSAPGISVSGDTNTGIYFPAADTIGFVEGGVESMRLDASGNLGLGVTPSAWGGGKAFEVGGSGSGLWWYGSTSLYNTMNCRFDGTGWKYGATGQASLYLQSAGQHIWNTAASGTAGTTISFTQAMTLDASGNLGVGTSSPGQKLSVYTSSNSLVIGASIRNDQAGSGVAAIGFNVSSAAAADVSSSKAGIGLVRQNVQGVGSLCFYNSGSTAAGDFTTSDERMRIDASGNVGIGTSSPANFGGVNLQVQNSGIGSIIWSNGTHVGQLLASAAAEVSIGSRSNSPLRFGTNDTERARIDTSGNLLVGTTTTGGKISLTNTPSTEWGVWFNTTVDIANGGNSAFANGSGMIIVTEAGVNGASAVYIMGGGQVTLVSTTSSTYWDSATTTPAAGKASIAYSGTAYTLYNNQGGLRTFYVAMLRTRNNV